MSRQKSRKSKPSSLVNNGRIRSAVPNDTYRDNFDRIFSNTNNRGGNGDAKKEGAEVADNG